MGINSVFLRYWCRRRLALTKTRYILLSLCYLDCSLRLIFVTWNVAQWGAPYKRVSGGLHDAYRRCRLRICTVDVRHKTRCAGCSNNHPSLYVLYFPFTVSFHLNLDILSISKLFLTSKKSPFFCVWMWILYTFTPNVSQIEHHTLAVTQTLCVWDKPCDAVSYSSLASCLFCDFFNNTQ